MSTPERGPSAGGDLLHEAELLTPAAAAQIAGRSVRTIRRAYLAGKLLAYRDGGGRGVRILYGDLRDWMMREPAAPPRIESAAPVPGRPIGGFDPRRRKPSAGPSENLALLNAARRRRLMRHGRAGADARRAEARVAAPQA